MVFRIKIVVPQSENQENTDPIYLHPEIQETDDVRIQGHVQF